ncbi:hypothetical protein Scep_006472 [Stephania cephalantha]|uniref:Response regulatory domain-containing protein n=1 Tax=Stephania cephalantha TaxID=152367 RepID=A0AAP0PN07_9MAGN
MTTFWWRRVKEEDLGEWGKRRRRRRSRWSGDAIKAGFMLPGRRGGREENVRKRGMGGVRGGVSGMFLWHKGGRRIWLRVAAAGAVIRVVRHWQLRASSLYCNGWKENDGIISETILFVGFIQFPHRHDVAIGKEVAEIGSNNDSASFPSGLRVLLVDDDPIFISVDEGLNALTVLRETKGAFDLVITDVHMPMMDGFALMEHIIREFKIPVIMMSADDKFKVVTRGLELGACFYLFKPLTLADVQNLWQHVVRKRKEYMLENNSACVHPSPPRDRDNTMREDTASSFHHDNSSMRDIQRGDNSSQRRMPRDVKHPRMMITNMFLEAIDTLGIEKIPAVHKEAEGRKPFNGPKEPKVPDREHPWLWNKSPNSSSAATRPLASTSRAAALVVAPQFRPQQRQPDRPCSLDPSE